MELNFIQGSSYIDDRGVVLFNNNFDASLVKRIYIIENLHTEFVRAWQGHRIEHRWFSAVNGSFEIKLIHIDNWEAPSPGLKSNVYTLESDRLNVLKVPPGFVTSIRALVDKSRLLVMSDYLFGETQDEVRFNSDYFYN